MASAFPFINELILLLIPSGLFLLELVLMFPDLVTIAVIFLIYTNALTVGVHDLHVPVIAGSVFPALLLLPIGRSLFIQRKALVINLPFLFMLLYLVVQALGALFATDPNAAMGVLTTYLTEGVILYFLVINAVRTPRVLKWAVIAVALAGLVMGSIVLFQRGTHTFSNNYAGFAQIGDISNPAPPSDTPLAPSQQRQSGPIGEPNRFGQIMAMAVPLALALSIGLRGWKSSLLFLAVALITAIGSILTYSRGTVLALAVIGVLMFVMRFIRLRYLPIFLLPLFFIPLVVPDIASRLQSFNQIDVAGLVSSDPTSSITTADQSVRSRATEMISSLLMFADHPIIGVGPGNYPVHYSDYARQVAIEIRLANRQPHFLYGGIAAENGILGLGCFLAIVGFTLRDLFVARRGWRKKDATMSTIAAGLILAIFAYLVSSLFLHFAYIRYIWLVMALAGAAGSIYKSSVSTEAEGAQ